MHARGCAFEGRDEVVRGALDLPGGEGRSPGADEHHAEEPRAQEIVKQAKSMGFAVVGEWVQEVAEMYAEGLQAQALTVDVSEVGR